ncbi:MAG: SDR family NAD(P)-dependent oxidoreductase [Bacteroidales bacterium]|nr:SDR family NAD(P)-dependent oxidoreductase [Bacteroidales bacterium]MDT8432172.1 SDR family NAD(P)-dependent oxidoreductase [Bacteroidales bacterium]
MRILITGASRGIGAELALQLAAEDQHLFLVARTEDRLREVANQCNALGGAGAAVAVPYDLAGILDKPAGFTTLLEQHTDCLDVLVNNAGLLVSKPFATFTPAEERRVFDTNYFMPAQLIRICMPFLERSAAASVINVTSMGAVQGSAKFPGLSAYSSSKGALAILTECLAEEFKTLNIKVNALAFGAVQTEMLEEAFPGLQSGTSPQEMGSFFKWFVMEGWRRMNGKMLPVSDSTP